VFINPEQYQSTPAYDLLTATARGLIGFDHRLIHALVDDPARTLPDILRFAMEDRFDDRVDMEEELVALFRYLRTPEALPFYVAYLRRNVGEDVSEEIMSALREIGEPAIQPLLDLYEELGEDEAGEIPYILSSFRERDDRILTLLLDRMQFDAVDGLLLLGLYGDASARPAIEALLAGLGDDPSAALIRTEAEFALEHFNQPRVDGFPEPETIWEQYPDSAGPFFAILDDEERVGFLGSSSAEYRAAAVRHFYNRELERPLRDQIFKMAQEDSSVSVRAQGWETLGSAVDEKPIREAIAAKLNDEAAPLEERCGALVGLAFESDDPIVRARMLEFYENPESRAKALEAMWRSLDRSFAEFIPKHLDDPDPEIKRNAIWGTGYLGIGTEAGKLREFFEEEAYRSDALFAYALSVPAEISRGRIRGLLRKIDEVSGGLDQDELELVEMALDERLTLHGIEPVFATSRASDELEPLDEEPVPDMPIETPPANGKVGRNDPCPCGSGKKYKKCCGASS
jgi:hypothetical protein